MIRHELGKIQRMVEGSGLYSEQEQQIVIRGVSIDSRSVRPGNLFIPLQGRLDGHAFVEEAVSKGATAALWQKDRPNAPSHLPLIYVDDCLTALQLLAARYREELSAVVIGVTGSNGKTTTKDMISSVLGMVYRVQKTAGNLNSQIGVPLTLLEIDPQAEVAVIEMGMSQLGQMEQLSRIVQPNIAVITMIGVSHLSTLGSREAIAAAKLEIVRGIREQGVLIYNGDEPLLAEGICNARLGPAIAAISFGEGEGNDFHVAGDVHQDGEGSYFTVQGQSFHLPLLGIHNISNALAAIAVAAEMKVQPQVMAQGFRSLTVTGMRMEKIESPLGFTIINDAWNASPISMSAAIRSLEAMTGYSNKHVVLGDMLELGAQEQQFHQELGRQLDPDAIDYVYTIGDLGQLISLEAEQRFPKGRVQAYSDKALLGRELRQKVGKNDVILLKGSRGMELESLLSHLT